MSRNYITHAIVLKINRIGEIHKGVILLTKDLGIISTIAHGAWKMKSKLRACTQIFNYLKVYLYFNPIKQTYKITDAESIILYDTVVQSIKKFYIMSVCAEVTLKSFGGGESVGEMFSLFLMILTFLEKISENNIDFLLIQFLWRFLIITGHRPDTRNCCKCGAGITEPMEKYYCEGMSGLVCGKCKNSHAVQFYPGMIRYLEMTENLDINQSAQYKVEKKSEKTLIKVLAGIVETCLEVPLQSIRKGEGIMYSMMHS